jgi:hypothetical protein
MDETTLSLSYPLRQCWMKRGQQQHYPAHTGYRRLLHLIGAYDWQTDAVQTQAVACKTGTAMVVFLEWLCLEVYPTEPLILVLDNASYHHTADVHALLSLMMPRVQVVWLPKYSPDMNPIERFWLHLKNQVYAHRLFGSLAALGQHIDAWLTGQNSPTYPERYVSAKSLRQTT